MENEELIMEDAGTPEEKLIGEMIDVVVSEAVNKVFSGGRDEKIVLDAYRIICGYKYGESSVDVLNEPIEKLESVTKKGNKKHLFVVAQYLLAICYFFKSKFIECEACIRSVHNVEVTFWTAEKGLIHEYKQKVVSLAENIAEYRKHIAVALNNENVALNNENNVLREENEKLKGENVSLQQENEILIKKCKTRLVIASVSLVINIVLIVALALFFVFG